MMADGRRIRNRPARKRSEPTASRWVRAIDQGLLSAVVGAGVGVIIAMFTGVMWLVWFFPLVTGITGYLVGALVIESAVDGARRLFLGSRVGTRAEYSVAEGLVARGEYAAALDAYRMGEEQEPGDPTPLIRGALLLRDHLGRPAEALEWLQRARGIGRLTETEEVMIARELADLYERHLHRHGDAIRELAGLAERHPDTNVGNAARRRLREIRERALERHGDHG
jgi:hypothetical protein